MMLETLVKDATVAPGEESGVIAWRLGLRKGDTAVAAERILYVNYNPATLIRDEQLLMRAGYEVASVFGTYRLMACGSVAEYTCVLLDDACPPEDRGKVITWLTANFPKLNVLRAGKLSNRRYLSA
jgi:hypothetical protein